jgi:hypothetical protein
MESSKIEILVERLDENLLEVNQQSLYRFKEFKNKRLAIISVFGNNRDEISDQISTYINKETISRKDDKSCLYFTYHELKDNTIVVLLYFNNDKDKEIKMLTSLLSSNIIYTLTIDTNESKILTEISYLDSCVLDENTNVKSIPIDFELEELFPHITFLNYQDELPSFKSSVSKIL